VDGIDESPALGSCEDAEAKSAGKSPGKSPDKSFIKLDTASSCEPNATLGAIGAFVCVCSALASPKLSVNDAAAC
jgi:hypothetical protein